MSLIRRAAVWPSVLLLVVVGVILLAVTADEGGYRLYHPYEVYALVAFGAAAILTVAAIWRYLRQRWQG